MDKKIKEAHILFWMFAPMVSMLPTWWAAFTAENISAISGSQWWMFVVSNIIILSQIPNPPIKIKILYGGWTAITASMQLAIWYRVGFGFTDIPWGIWWWFLGPRSEASRPSLLIF